MATLTPQATPPPTGSAASLNGEVVLQNGGRAQEVTDVEIADNGDEDDFRESDHLDDSDVDLDDLAVGPEHATRGASGSRRAAPARTRTGPSASAGTSASRGGARASARHGRGRARGPPGHRPHDTRGGYDGPGGPSVDSAEFSKILDKDYNKINIDPFLEHLQVKARAESAAAASSSFTLPPENTAALLEMKPEAPELPEAAAAGGETKEAEVATASTSAAAAPAAVI